jgi:hypothetical protein
MSRFAILLTAVVLTVFPIRIAVGFSAPQSSGKIVGTITDAESGETLPGANILVVGTSLGAAADIDGEYLILQAPPGEHSLRITMVGYATVLVENVKVNTGLTARVDMALQPAAIELGEEIVVTAERPVIQKDETSSVVYLDAIQLAQLPVTDATKALMIQSGLLFDPEPIIGGLGGSGRGEARYAVRGGEQSEVLWFIDGARVASLVEGRADQGGSFTEANLHAIQEIQVLTGGFDAEYGNAQSGVVNILTKEGGQRFNGSFEYIYGPSGQRHFGNYLYDQETQKEFIDNTLEDGTLNPDWWTEARQSQIYDYRNQGDHHMYGSLGGSIFRKGNANATFFVAGQLKREAYLYPRPRETRDLGDIQGNIVIRPKPEMKLRLSGLYSKTAHSTLQENGDFTNQVKYYRGWGSLIDDRSLLFSANWTHALTPRLFYDVRLSRYELDMRETPSEFLRFGQSSNPTLFGFQRYDGFPQEPFDEYSFSQDQHHTVADLSLESTANWQVNNSNLLKGGIELRRNTYNEHFAYRYPSVTFDERYWLNRGLHEVYHPMQFAAFVQDKMEFASMILNVGLRYDVFHPNVDWFTSRDIFNLSADPDFDPALDPDGDQVDENGRVKYSFDNVLDKPRSPAKTFHRISPRIGVSFPVSSVTVLHFSYGHFYQMPPLDRMFELNYFRPEYIVKGQIAEDEAAAAEGREPAHIPSLDGDPERVVIQTLDDLSPEKTVSFEVGIVHNFGDLVVLDLTGFYKDVFDQSEPRQGIFDRRVYMYDPFRGATTSNVFFVSAFPGDYGDARGFEAALRTLFSSWITVSANYSFSQVSRGRATPGTIRYDEAGNPTFEYNVEASLRLPSETTFSRPHIFRMNLYLKYPDKPGSNSLINSILSGTSASGLFTYVSGRAFTYIGPEDPPDTRDNQRLPPIHTLDMRIEKQFSIAGNHGFSAYVNVANLFNTKNLRSFGDVFFDAEATKNFVEDGTISTVDGAGYDISWQTYFQPRFVQLGFRYNLR